MKRCLAVFLSFLIYASLTAQQLPNPYASIGKPMPQIATLSGGAYDEFLLMDSIILINGDAILRRTGELLFEVETDSVFMAELYRKQDESFRFLSVDPLTKDYPMLTPYQFASNTPIMAIDLDGEEAKVVIYGYYLTEKGTLTYGLKYEGEINIETFNAVHHAMGIPINEPLKDNGVIYFVETESFVNVTNSKYGIQKGSAGPVYKWYYKGENDDGTPNNKKGEFPIETMEQNYGGLYEATMLGALHSHQARVNSRKGISRPWASKQDGNYVGELANKVDKDLGKTVLGIDIPYTFSGGTGDIDISTGKFNIEVKSGGKMKLTQSIKNMEYSTSEKKRYILYMPGATSNQVFQGAKSGITVVNSYEELLKMIR